MKRFDTVEESRSRLERAAKRCRRAQERLEAASDRVRRAELDLELAHAEHLDAIAAVAKVVDNPLNNGRGPMG